MSSSKIFKNDPSFTPVSLVSEKIQPDSVDMQDQHPIPVASETEQPEQEGVQSPPAQEMPSPASQPPLPDLDAIRAEAYAQGKLDAQQGTKENEQVQLSDLRQTIEAFSRACAEVDNLHGELLEQSRGDMINLVIALSKKIIGHEISTGRDVIASTLKNAIDLAMKYNEYDIWIHPDDLAVVEKMVPELIRSVQQLNHITLKTDPNILQGGCRLDSDICTVDATIEAQLETAREFLEEKSSNDDDRIPNHTDDDIPAENP